jgi:hypothetical protein
MEPLRPPARLAEDALALRRGSKPRSLSPTPPLARPPADRGRDAGTGQGRESIPYPTRLAPPVPAPRARARMRHSSRRRGARRGACRSRQPGRAAQGGGRRLDRAGRPGPEPSSRRSSRGSGLARRRSTLPKASPARLAGPRAALVRLQLVRRRLPLPGRRQPDLPIRLPNLVATVAHETYPAPPRARGEKERRLVEELARLESSILLINAPECLISEAGQPRRGDRGATRGALGC